MRPATRKLAAALLVAAACAAGCLRRPTANPNVFVVGIPSAPANLDPRIAPDDVSQKLDELMFDSLAVLDDHMQVVPQLAERIEQPSPTVYVVPIKHGVMFHDGHELTAADVVYTFRSFLDPSLVSTRKGAYREVASIDARDRYTVVFTLKQAFASFPINLVMPIVPEGAGPAFREHPVGTGPYKFVRYAVDDRLELAAFDGYYRGRPRNDGLVFKVIPDDVMRGLELRKGTTDIVINDLTPDIAFQLRDDRSLQEVDGPGVDYQYVGLNLRDPVLKDVRVRQALAYAIDRNAIVKYLRRGLAQPAVGLIPPLSWAFADDAFAFPYDPDKARALLDQAGYRDPDGDGPEPRLRLNLKISTAQEFNRLQASVIQQNLRAVGIDLDVRTYEFATLFSDVLKGNFQMYVLQWTAGSLADPDILRRVFHSKQAPPVGFNRGYYSNPKVDALLDEAASSNDAERRTALFKEVQRIVARDVPYISLWTKTNVAVARRSLANVRLTPLADLRFLAGVARTDRL